MQQPLEMEGAKTWVAALEHMAIVQARPPDSLYVKDIEARFGGIDLYAEAVAFRTSWTGRPKALASLRDWRMAWLNWLKKVVAGPNYRRRPVAKAAGPAALPDDFIRAYVQRQRERGAGAPGSAAHELQRRAAQRALDDGKARVVAPDALPAPGHKAGGVYVGRPGPFGNPFVLGRDGDRATVVAKHREWLWLPEQHALRSLIREKLQGRSMWCPGCQGSEPCHKTNLAEVAESPREDGQ